MTTAPDWLDSKEFLFLLIRLNDHCGDLIEGTEEFGALCSFIRKHFVPREKDDDALTAAYLLGYEDGLAGKEKRKL